LTFLFSDVEGSTRLLARLGAGYAPVLEQHRRLLRAACATRDGVELGTEGDSLVVAFARASDAVAAAVAGQRALAAHPWPDGVDLRVRMGLHTGEVDLTADGDDYVGLALHVAARVGAAGHGSQILLSDVTARLAPDAEVIDLGEHVLEDLVVPVRLLQVAIPDLPRRFPPLRTVDRARHNLPVARTGLIGRDTEVARVVDLVRAHRLVTLTGVGGTGKTRLALAAAAVLLGDFPDGVRLVELAPISDPHRVAELTAETVGVRAPPGTDAAGPIAAREVLVVLDNCEHLLDPAADLVERVLAAGGDAHILATSREALDVAGEQVHRVPPLSAPTGDSGGAALDLLLERVAQASDGRTFVDVDLAAAAEICRRLDGLPLAIELAAAPLAHLSPVELLDRLDQRFDLLVGNGRDRRRRQTLQATMDWSWDLLDPDQQRLLAGLSVFADRWSLPAAEGVCGGLVQRPVAVVLRSLVAASLVEPLVTPSGGRHRLLETVRVFAGGKLDALGLGEAVRRAHRDWYLAQAEAIPFDEALLSRTQDRQLSPEVDDVAVAIEWSLERDEVDAAAALVIATRAPRRGMAAMARERQVCRWVATVLARRPTPPVAARLLVVGAITAVAVDPQLGAEWSSRAYDLACERDDPAVLAVSATWLARGRIEGDPSHAAALLDEAEAAAARSGSAYISSLVVGWRLQHAFCTAMDVPLEVDPARLGPRLALGRGIALATAMISAAWCGRAGAAAELLREQEELVEPSARENSMHRPLLPALLGDAPAARRAAEAALAAADREGDLRWRAEVALILAVIRFHEGAPEAARAYLEASRERPLFAPAYAAIRRRYVEMATAALTPEALDRAVAAGRGLSLEAIIDRELRPPAGPTAPTRRT
jgi:predicted ATPase/class 3 adenylate cyclase